MGSPPQVRGKRCTELRLPHTHGITPAGAGKTVLFFAADFDFWDHPRRCGENALVVPSTTNLTGSPPQVRGKHFYDNFYRCDGRITPAGAGKTLSGAEKCRQLRDHPRRCGENLIVYIGYYTLIGSPPQVRGKHANVACYRIRDRITPAGAGKTY